AARLACFQGARCIYSLSEAPWHDGSAGRVVNRCPQVSSGGPLMRAALMVVLGFAFVLVTAARAQEEKKGKEVTLKGTITCAKCDLAKEDSCMTVIVVKEKGKD